MGEGMLKYPCKNCEKRYPGCHSKCEAYQDVHKRQEEIYKNKQEFLMHTADVKYRTHCMKTRKHSNKKGI